MTNKTGNTQAFFNSVADQVENTPDFNSAFSMGKWLSHHLWKNTCGIYRMDRIEIALLNTLADTELKTPEHSNGELHLTSKLYSHGGHTPLLLRVLETAKTTDSPAVLLTDPSATKAAQEILPVGTKLIAPAATLKTKALILWLANQISAARRVILHIHPDDLTAALAVRLAKQKNPRLEVGFMNHADHVFSVGIGAADKIFEISAYGWQLRSQRDSHNISRFIGIPILAKEQDESSAGAKLAISGGAAYKYKPSATISLPKLLSSVLDRNAQLQLLVIGAKWTNSWWWAVKARYWSRLSLAKLLPRTEYQNALGKCSLYIDSAPITGGTAFPEALMRGLAVIGLNEGMIGYSVADKLRVAQCEFSTVATQILSKDPTQTSRQETIRAECKTYHSPLAVRQRIEDAFNNHLSANEPPDFVVPVAVLEFEESWKNKKKLKLSYRAWKTLTLEQQARLLGLFKQYIPGSLGKKYRLLYLLRRMTSPKHSLARTN